MPILSLRPRAFRTRNPGRDEETDTARIETVRNAIAMALADARRERDGLMQRMDTYYAQAASMLDSAADYRHRSTSEETAIRSAEKNATNARRRLEQLDAQIAKFGAMIDALDQKETPGGRAPTGNASVA